MATNTNYAVAPGEYLQEWLDETGVTQNDAASRLGCSRKQVNDLVHGRAPITAETAIKLERLTGIPVDSWMRFEARYRADLARLKDESALAEHVEEIPPSTAKFLRQFGATSATKRAPGRLVADFLTFHGLGTWEAFEASIEQANRGEFALAALKESTSRLDSIACQTWLRAGEMTEAWEQGRSLTFNADELRQMMPDLRRRAARSDGKMLRDIAGMLRETGVVFTMVEAPEGLPLYGMTRWIDSCVPMIQQSGRRSKDGFTVWTLFHELGHVLNDPRGSLHLDFKNERTRNTAAEKGANRFAFDTLFGGEGLAPWDGMTSNHDISRIAEAVGVSPGVAVHQLHRKRKLDYRWGNQLFVDLEWLD